MKTIKNWIPLFLGGFLLMAVAQLTIHCEDFLGPGNNGEEEIIDEKEAEKAAKDIEDAFLSGEQQKVIDLITPSSQPFYSELVQKSSPETLIAFGEAFKDRTLSIISERYAEYKFIVGGVAYSLALSLTEEGNWEIMRL